MLCTLEGISHARGEEYAGLMQGIDHCFASLPFCVSVVAVLAAVDTRKCFGAFFFSDQGLSPRVAVGLSDHGQSQCLCNFHTFQIQVQA